MLQKIANRKMQTVLTMKKKRKVQIQEETEMKTYQLNIWNTQLLSNFAKLATVKNDNRTNLLI